MFGREPSLIIGALTSIITGLLMLLTGDASATSPDLGWLLLAIPLLQGLWTRFKVFAPKTLERAGLDPKAVEEMASGQRPVVRRG